MELQILYLGSTVTGIIEEAREKQNDYSTFVSQMESVKQWNKGTSMENLLRKIYAKYIYQGNEDTDELEMLYSNVLELIASATSEYDLQEVESIVSNLLSEEKIKEQEYNYLMNSINDKRKEL